MSSPKVFDGPLDAHIPPPRDAQEGVLSKKRSADSLETISTPLKKRARKNAAKGERERYEKLKADTMCQILSEHSVRCLQCLGKIQLSKKNNYDQEHWMKHRQRCMKQSDKKVAELSAKNRQMLGRMSTTPELTADSASETSSVSGAKSESSDFLATGPVPAHTTPPPAAAPWLDPSRGRELYSDYMARAHPGMKPFRPTSPGELLIEMRAWVPTSVKPPVWFESTYVDPEKLRLRPAVWAEDTDSSDDESPEEASVRHPHAPYTPDHVGEGSSC
ncbi:hypothetical protein FKP32DRAFT_1604050 [Trametes sanguinea]|nr:hypothetical protein FKP32DRAFT_1604050 [Trametes sanguinea]